MARVVTKATSTEANQTDIESVFLESCINCLHPKRLLGVGTHVIAQVVKHTFKLRYSNINLY